MSLGPDARSLIAAADGADDPTSADQARIRAKLAARLAVAAGTGIAATTAAKTATASAGTAATTSIAAKIAIGLAVVSATTGTAVLYERAAHERTPTVEAAASPTPPPVNVNVNVNVNVPVLASATEAEPTPLATATPVPPQPAAKPIAIAKKPAPAVTIAATDTIAEEAALLRSAHASLATGDGASAMKPLDEHARRFPRGALAEEREAARVMALCAQGRASEARASASAFVAGNPRSPFVAQVRRTCAERNSND